MAKSRALAAVVVLAALVFQGCGDDGSSRDSAANTKIAYGGALVSAADLGFVADDFVVADEGGTADTHLRVLCGRGARRTPTAAAGEFRELRSPKAAASVTSSVHAFANEVDAKKSFDSSRRIARSCSKTTPFTSHGATFVATSSPTIQNGGDESFSLFARQTDTGLVVADHVVRRGRYILDVHFDVSQGAAVDAGILATVATEASREFASWADDH
jgi:hypothetical protein